MDSQNVITITNDLSELETDMTNWLSLTYDERKRSDMVCIDRYNCTNIELFNNLKANIVRNTKIENTEYLGENFHIIDDPNYSDLSMEVLFYKIQTSNFLQKNDSNIIIINDFLSDNEPDYTLEDLNNKYNEYIKLSCNYKGISNDYSLDLWGKTVSEMYTYIKQKLLKYAEVKTDIKMIRPDVTHKSLVQYESEIKDSIKRRNFIEYCLYSVDCKLSKSTIYESAVLNSFIKENEFEPKFNFKDDVPQITPFFTYDEYCNIIEQKDDKINPFEYIFIEDGKKYYDTIKRLQESGCNDKQLKLGWSPYVKITPESMRFAREKQINWLNINEQCTIIDFSNYTTKLSSEELMKEDGFNNTDDLKPVYIVLSYTGTVFGKIINKFEKSKFSHVGLSLSSTLTEIYSFNLDRKNGNGCVVESLDDYNDKNKDAKLLVLTFFIDDKAYIKLKDTLKFYIEHKDQTKYSIKNIVRIVVNKAIESNSTSLEMVCSQFVDTVMSLCNIKITEKPSNLVAPGDFEKVDNPKLFVVFEGYKKNYNFREIQSKVKAIILNRSYNQLNITKEDNIIESFRERLIEGFNIDSVENKNIHNILKSLREYIAPDNSIIYQESKIPLGFNNSGDLYINLPKNLQNEYNESHRLLYMYNETNIYGIKNELARLFYINSIIEKKLKKLKRESSEYKELIDLRARVLNDYNTFFKVIKVKEPDFDFMNYIKNSDYYNKSIIIDGSTLKYSGHYIKTALKSLLQK